MAADGSCAMQTHVNTLPAACRVFDLESRFSTADNMLYLWLKGAGSLYKYHAQQGHESAEDRTSRVVFASWAHFIPTVRAESHSGRTAQTEPSPPPPPPPPVQELSGDQKLKKMLEEYKHVFKYEEEGETGASRLKAMLMGLPGGMTAESQMIMQTSMLGFISGFLYGMTQNSRVIIGDFIRKHNEMTFEGEFHARRKMHDFVFIQVVKNGIAMGWRVAVFPSLFAIGIFSSLAYRNYCQPLDFAATGVLLGGLWKFKQGPKAMVAGAAVGGTLGLVGGLCCYGAFKFSGASVAELRYWKSNSILRQETFMRGKRHKAGKNHMEQNSEIPECEQLVIDHEKRRVMLKALMEEEAATATPPTSPKEAEPEETLLSKVYNFFARKES